MSCEGGPDKSEDQKTGIPEDQNTRRPFNYSAATRRFERFLMAAGGGADPLGLRDYRTSWEKAITPRPSSRVHEPDPGGRIIAKMFFNPDTGEEKIVRFDDPDFDKY